MDTKKQRSLDPKIIWVLGISRRGFKRYCRTFLSHRIELLVKTCPSGGWVNLWRKKHKACPYKERMIFRHLRGFLWIARSYPKHGKYFAIEIGKGMKAENRLQLCRKISSAIPHPLILRTDKDGTIQLYWFLCSAQPKEDIEKALISILVKNGISPIGRSFVTFPGTCQYLRLPLGRDSTILNNETLCSYGFSLQQSITYISNLKPYGERIFGRSIIKQRTLSSIFKGSPVTENERKTVELFDKINNTLVKPFLNIKLLRLGLWSPILQYGTRFHRQSLLIQECYKKRLNEEQAFKDIIQWYRTEKHFSNDWNDDPARVENELKESISKYYNIRRQFGQETRVPVPSDAIKNILEKFEDEERLWTKNIYARQKFMFHIVQLYISQKTTILPLPSKLLGILDGAGFMSASGHLEFWIKQKALSILPKISDDKYRCRRYKLEWNLISPNSIRSFDEGLGSEYSYYLHRYRKEKPPKKPRRKY